MTTAGRPQPRDDVTRLVADLGRGNASAADRLVPLLYDELRGVAAERARRSGVAGELQPTEVVHEAYLRLVDQTRIDSAGRTHFFAVCARVIRNVLVDAARRRGAQKRGGQRRTVPLEEAEAVTEDDAFDLLALDQALDKLAQLDARQAKIVELRFFGGLTGDEIARLLGLSRRTVQGDWAMARTWLRHQLG